MVHDVFLNDPPATIISELGPVRTLLSTGRAQRNKTTTTGEEEEEEELCVQRKERDEWDHRRNADSWLASPPRKPSSGSTPKPEIEHDEHHADVVLVDTSGDRMVYRTLFDEWMTDPSLDGFVLVFDVTQERSLNMLVTVFHSALAARARAYIQAVPSGKAILSSSQAQAQGGSSGRERRRKPKLSSQAKADKKARAKARKSALKRSKKGKRKGPSAYTTLSHPPQSLDEMNTALNHSLLEELDIPPFIVIGTHGDAPDDVRFASSQELETRVRNLFGASYCEISSRTGQNVDLALSLAARHVSARLLSVPQVGVPLPASDISREGFLSFAVSEGSKASERYVVLTTHRVVRLYASRQNAQDNTQSEILLLAPGSHPAHSLSGSSFIMDTVLGSLTVSAPSGTEAASWLDSLNAPPTVRLDGQIPSSVFASSSFQPSPDRERDRNRNRNRDRDRDATDDLLMDDDLTHRHSTHPDSHTRSHTRSRARSDTGADSDADADAAVDVFASTHSATQPATQQSETRQPESQPDAAHINDIQLILPDPAPPSPTLTPTPDPRTHGPTPTPTHHYPYDPTASFPIPTTPTTYAPPPSSPYVLANHETPPPTTSKRYPHPPSPSYTTEVTTPMMTMQGLGLRSPLTLPHAVVLRWDTHPNASFHRLYRQTPANNIESIIYEGRGLMHYDSDRASHTTYAYRVDHLDRGGRLVQTSGPIVVTTPAS